MKLRKVIQITELISGKVSKVLVEAGIKGRLLMEK